MTQHPLLLEPILKAKVWGGRQLSSLGKALPDSALVGESWELADLASTSLDGGGGEEARSRIVRGEMRGLTLHQAMVALGPNLMGGLRADPTDAGFPLLLKYLDAQQNLSVQVHPSHEYAARHSGAAVKSESWYVVASRPGAVIYKGLREGTSRQDFESALRAGSVVDCLNVVPVSAGDYHDLPSGICHALGAGIMVAEIQTPSDTTFRLFDWGREGRALHVDEALECMSFDGALAPGAVRSNGSARFRLGVTAHYTIDELRLEGESEHRIENHPAPPSGGPMVWMVIAGEGRLHSDDDSWAPIAFARGHTMLFPSAIESFSADIARDSTILEIRFPMERLEACGLAACGPKSERR